MLDEGKEIEGFWIKFSKAKWQFMYKYMSCQILRMWCKILERDLSFVKFSD